MAVSPGSSPSGGVAVPCEADGHTRRPLPRGGVVWGPAKRGRFSIPTFACCRQGVDAGRASRVGSEGSAALHCRITSGDQLSTCVFGDYIRA